MTTIVTRAGKGSPLTNAEVDANFTNLNTAKLEASNNLSDLANAATARSNLGVAIGTNVQAWDADLDAIAALAGTSGFLKKTAANTWSLDTSTYLTGNQTITFTGDATGSGATSVALTLANSGVTAGTYTKVTVDAKGRVTTGAPLTSADVTTALGFTPYNSTNPNGYITSSDSITGSAYYGYVQDTRSSVQGPNLGDKRVRWDFVANSTDGLNDGGSYHGVMTFQQWTDASGGGTRQLGFTDNDNLWIRGSGSGVSAYGAWKLILNSSNYTSYAPTKTGGGASGTWGISITGNAGYASTVGINYNNDSNSTYQMLWGSGNSVYGTGGIYCNPASDYLYATSMYVNGDWFRQSGSNGHYWESYGRGIRVADAEFSYGSIGTYGSGLNGWRGFGVWPNNFILMSNGSTHGFYNPANGLWQMQMDSSGNATFNGNVTAYSDLRLKQNVREIDNILARRDTLANAAIKYERDGRTRIGYGAQLLRDNGCAEFVQEADDALKLATGMGTLSVDYGETTAILAVASKLTDARVAALETEVAQLLAAIQEMSKG